MIEQQDLVVLVLVVAQRRGHRDHAAEDLIGRLTSGPGGAGVVGGVADLAQQIDQLLDVAHEVAAREVLVVEHVLERLPRRPGVGQREERRVGRPGQRQPAGLFVGVQLDGQLGELGDSLADLGGREPGGRGRHRTAVLVGEAGRQSSQ